MRAMVLARTGEALEARSLPDPAPAVDELLVRVSTCGVCRTDLHVVDGDLTQTLRPLVPGHQVVGAVVGRGASVDRFVEGDRVGIPWLGGTCGACRYCVNGRENLCDDAEFTGYSRHGGYAELITARAAFALAVPDRYDDVTIAPMLCAGLIGYRSLRLAGEAERVGLYGFGASAHIVAQVARHRGQRVFAFTRPGDDEGQHLARELGAKWAGGSDQLPPERLDAAIVFAPVGALVPQALRAVVKGGSVVCAGIHMSEIPAFPYELLWGERTIRSVANLTRRDGEEFMRLIEKLPLAPLVERFALENANVALDRLRSGALAGAAVLEVGRAAGNTREKWR